MRRLWWIGVWLTMPMAVGQAGTNLCAESVTQRVVELNFESSGLSPQIAPVVCATALPTLAIYEQVPMRFLRWTDTNADTVIQDGEITALSSAQIDTVKAAEAARAQVLRDEIVGNDLCTAELTDITNRINTFRDSVNADIIAASTVAQIKTVLTTMNTTYAVAFRKTARCVRARAR